MRPTRRDFNSSLAASGLLALGMSAARANGAGTWPSDLQGTVARLELTSGGRLGVSLLDTATGAKSGYRAEERFPICSTFKVLAAGAILTRVDAGREQLERRIRFAATDLVANSPITQQHVADGMTLAELCAAAIDYSDNTAGNILLSQIGGPSGLTAFARALGDQTTRLDRTETALNEALPGDPRDTSSPEAMLADLHQLALGSALTRLSRAHLIGWLRGNTTGGARLRAGFPKDWDVGDKTGTGERGTANHIAVVWPPGRKPILVAVYLTGSTISSDNRNAVFVDIAKAITEGLPQA